MTRGHRYVKVAFGYSAVLCVALLATALLWAGPTIRVTTESEIARPDGSDEISASTTAHTPPRGARVQTALRLGVPLLLLTGLPLLARGRWTAVAVRSISGVLLLAGGLVLSLYLVGVLYLPAAGLLLAAAVAAGRSEP